MYPACVVWKRRFQISKISIVLLLMSHQKSWDFLTKYFAFNTVITLSHHTNIKLLPGIFQLAIYVFLIVYLVWGILLFLIKNEYVWHFFFRKKLKIVRWILQWKMFLYAQPLFPVISLISTDFLYYCRKLQKLSLKLNSFHRMPVMCMQFLFVCKAIRTES